MRHILLGVLFCVSSIIAAPASAVVNIPTVLVGDAGNLPDLGFATPGGLIGAVDHNYRIGTTEVTVGQYTAFLNAVGVSDPHALYNSEMASDLNVAGISRSGVSGSFSYSVIGSPNKPVAYVSFSDSIRFSNWLHNGQPTGPQNATTTEDGAYTLSPATDANPYLITRNSGAQWFVPTQSEWYKAAFYQPVAQGGDVDSWWRYATKSNTAPVSDPPPGLPGTQTNIANYVGSSGAGFAVTGSSVLDPLQNYLTDVGAYSSALSYYGTLDQAGNIYERTESTYEDFGVQFKVLRGGSWANGVGDLGALNGYLSNYSAQFENNTFGFRVAAVPEPSTTLLMIAGLAGVWLGRRRFYAR